MTRLTSTLRCRLTALRAAAGITQQQLALAADVSRQTIISVERGDYAPSVVLALRLSLLLGVPVEQMFSLPDSEVEALTLRRERLPGQTRRNRKEDSE